LAVTVALGQPSEEPLGGEVKQGAEPSGTDVDLALGVLLHIAWGQLLVLGDVPRGCRSLDAEARHQVLAADLANKPQAQLDEREPVALRLGHLRESVAGHVCALASVSFRASYTHPNRTSIRLKKLLYESQNDYYCRRAGGLAGRKLPRSADTP